ncbi:MAG: pseudouridine synthase [Cellvibrionaceae bacterium]
MRLDKFLSHSTGLARAQSRREINKGKVIVDGQKMKSASFNVDETNQIIFDNKTLSLPGKTYLMIHKPKNVVCANSDTEHATVIDLIQPAPLKKVSVAGRLDIDTTGLVLVSDDGQWIHKIISPNKDCKKTYRVTVAEDITDETVEQFKTGILLNGEDKLTKPSELLIAADTSNNIDARDKKTALVTISEGRYHQVKRMFAACENRVIELHRQQIGDILLDPNLKEGEYRPLTQEEINSIS